MDLRFATFASEIELPFYSALFASKLDHDKLDDSARPVLGLYEPRAHSEPASSTKMQILGNALTSNQYVQRPFLEEGGGEEGHPLSVILSSLLPFSLPYCPYLSSPPPRGLPNPFGLLPTNPPFLFRVPWGLCRAEGMIKNVNTIEDFKNTDKSAMLKNTASQVRWPLGS